MSFLLLDPIRETEFETFHEDVPATFGAGVSAAATDPILRPGLDLAPVQHEIAEAEGIGRPRSLLPARRGVLPRLGEPETVNPEGLTPIESPDRLNDEFGHLGLKFDRPTRRGVAEMLAREKREQRVRDDILARAPSGVLFGAAALGASFASAAIDPLNVAAAFIPVAREGRLAGMLARLSTPTRQRLARGAIEGAVGNALIEPGVMVMSSAQQRDYGMADALLNVTLGAGIGAGFRFGFGAIGDALGRASPQTREIAARAAIAQAVDGKRVDVDAILRFDDELFASTSVGSRGDLDTRLRAFLSEPSDTPLALSLDPRGTLVPVLHRRTGQPLEFATRAEAERAVSRRTAGGEIVETPEGIFTVADRRADLDALRDDAGELRTFQTKRQAEKFRDTNRSIADEDRSRIGVIRTRPVEGGANRFALVRGAAEDDLRRINAAPGRTIFPTPQRRSDRSSPVPDSARIREAALLIARREADPRRDATADFEAAERADAELTNAPSEFNAQAITDLTDREAMLIGRAAEEEANFEAALLEDMRGILGENDLRAIQDIDAIVSRAEGYAMAARTAGACLARA